VEENSQPRLTVGRPDGLLVVSGPSGEPLLEEAPLEDAGAIATASVDLRWWLLAAWWQFRRRLSPWRWAGCTQVNEGSGDPLLLLDDLGHSVVEVQERTDGPVAEGRIAIPDGTPGDWVRWRLLARPGEKFLGFGERFNAVDQRGNKLYVWTEEGAVGLGEKLGKLLDGAKRNPFANGPTTAYKPMPFFISSAGYGLLLDTFARVEYDVAATDSEVVDITIWDRSFDWVIFYGPGLADIVERFTERVGRPTVPAKWTFLQWNDEVFGSASVRDCARKLRENKIPTAALWTEDWQGGYWLTPYNKRRAPYIIFPFRQRVDRSLYHDIEEVASDLHAAGFRWLSYFLPYVSRRSEEFREARQLGYLLKNRSGGLARMSILWMPHGHIDLTNPEARQWLKEKLAANLALGFDGWMADFGEYVPPDAVTGSGETGLEHHNKYPLLWQQLNREVMDEKRPNGDYVFFCRSAAVGSQKYAPVFWTGDSNTDFERYDGLPSNLPAAINAGLCGLSIWAVDIGGYVVIAGARDKELFMRWTELAALLPVMRTHHGTHPGRCWSWDSDAETVEFFGRYCRLHTALFPYIFGLAHEASERWRPAVRHLAMHHGEDAVSWKTEDQFLLGDRLLVAPVVERGARGRTVYFPLGEWIDYWSGARHEGPATCFSPAPVDHLPLFVSSGKALPTLDKPVDTMVHVEPSTGLVGEQEALSTLRVTLYGRGTDRIALWDGTEIEIWRAPDVDGAALAGAVTSAEGSPPAPEPSPDRLQPVERRASPDFAVTVAGGTADVVLLDAAGNRLAGASAGGPSRERLSFEWR